MSRILTKSKIKNWKRVRAILNEIDAGGLFRMSVAIGTINGLLDLIAFSTILPLIIYLFIPESISKLPYIEQLIGGELSHSWVRFFAITLVIATSVRTLASIYLYKRQFKISYDIATKIGKAMVESYFKISYQKYTSSNSSEKAKIFSQAPISFVHNLFRSFQQIIIDAIVFVCVSVFLIIASPKSFGLGILITGIFGILIWRLIKPRLQKVNNRFKDLFASVHKYLFDAIDNFLTIRIHNKEAYFLKKFEEKYDQNNTLLAKSEYYKILPQRLFEFLGVMLFALIFVFFQNGVIGAEDVMITLTVFSLSFYRIIPITNKTIINYAAIRSNEHILDHIEQSLIQDEPVVPKSDIQFERKINLTNVCFYYDGQKPYPVLNDLNLEIRKGDWIGLIGESGIGKSTLSKILLGVLAPSKGDISIDDVKLEEKHHLSWFDKIGYLDQHPTILDTSIVENICFEEDPSEQTILQITKLIDYLGLGPWLKQYQNGLYTRLGDKGVKISGGQAKRIALARILFKEPDILLLDEFTNETDAESNVKLLNNLKELHNDGKTIIQVSHQSDALRLCTQVYELKNGNLKPTHASNS